MPERWGARARIAAGAVALLGAALALVPASARTWGAAASRLEPLWTSVSTTTLEGRRRAVYGVCEHLGYGYVADVLRAYPEADAIPIVKYPDWGRNVAVLLPGRRSRVDERVLIGIGVDEGLLAERAIARAAPAGERTEAGAAVGRWTFQTTYDYDLFTGVVLDVGPAAPGAGAGELAVTLLDGVRTGRVLGRWSVAVPAGGGRVALRLSDPLRRFSRGRGATDFVLDVARPPGVPRPVAVLPLGVRIDLRGYEVVQRRGRCSTALRDDLLAEARAAPDGRWGRFVRELRRE